MKLVGPGLDSMSPERRIKAKIRGLRQYWIREREKIRQKENEVRVKCEYC